MEGIMEIAVHQAKAKLTKLIAAVEAGEAVTITRHGVPVVDLVQHKQSAGKVDKIAALQRLRGSVQSASTPASQAGDFLYDDDGLPR